MRAKLACAYWVDSKEWAASQHLIKPISTLLTLYIFSRVARPIFGRSLCESQYQIRLALDVALCCNRKDSSIPLSLLGRCIVATLRLKGASLRPELWGEANAYPRGC